ncbi:hypothetical protein OC846_005893 [Tilletia horrida]|uniref:Uncharacterized protein n=1 Tax=Tilletia horrida TaxID=155126 RepID=A0AAN6GMH1_9BASI|nr:hypothetical protein OC846_005893 [Tilletia horrida]
MLQTQVRATERGSGAEADTSQGAEDAQQDPSQSDTPSEVEVQQLLLSHDTVMHEAMHPDILAAKEVLERLTLHDDEDDGSFLHDEHRRGLDRSEETQHNPRSGRYGQSRVLLDSENSIGGSPVAEHLDTTQPALKVDKGKQRHISPAGTFSGTEASWEFAEVNNVHDEPNQGVSTAQLSSFFPGQSSLIVSGADKHAADVSTSLEEVSFSTIAAELSASSAADTSYNTGGTSTSPDTSLNTTGPSTSRLAQKKHTKGRPSDSSLSIKEDQAARRDSRDSRSASPRPRRDHGGHATRASRDLEYDSSSYSEQGTTSASRKPTENSREVPLWELNGHEIRFTETFRAAGDCILDICKYGIVDPSVMADLAHLTVNLLRTNPDNSEPDPLAGPNDNALLIDFGSVNRSFTVMHARWLPCMVDIAAFSQTYREFKFDAAFSIEAKKKLQDTMTAYAKRHSGDPTSDHPPDKAATAAAAKKALEISTIGAKINGLAAILGSTSFLPFLLLSPQFTNYHKLKATNQHTFLCALSFLLRGGIPIIPAGMKDTERQWGYAVLFGAQVILPYALRWYLESASALFDKRTDRDGQPTKTPIRDVLYVAENRDSTHVQPTRNNSSEGVPLPSLDFGLMTGYGRRSRPHMGPPTWMLSPNYHKHGRNDEPAPEMNAAVVAAKDAAIASKSEHFTLADIFKKSIPQHHVAVSPLASSPTITLHASAQNISAWGPKYADQRKILRNHPKLQMLDIAARRGDWLAPTSHGQVPHAPTADYLWDRMKEVGMQPSMFFELEDGD